MHYSTKVFDIQERRYADGYQLDAYRLRPAATEF